MVGGIAPGTMVNLTLVGGQPALPDAARIEVPPGAYRVEAELELTGTVPFQGIVREKAWRGPPRACSKAPSSVYPSWLPATSVVASGSTPA